MNRMNVKKVLLKENKSIMVKEDTQYVLIPTYGDAKEQITIELEMVSQGVSAEIICLYRVGSKQTLNLTTIANHKVPNTRCTTNVRGVLLEGGSSNYIGKIIINKEAQQTSSYLDDSVLVLGQEIKNQSQPILEIEADDVKASHGATTGRIDESMVYYLMTRGLSRKEAEETIIQGFFESVLDTIVDDKIRTELQSSLLNDK